MIRRQKPLAIATQLVVALVVQNNDGFAFVSAPVKHGRSCLSTPNLPGRRVGVCPPCLHPPRNVGKHSASVRRSLSPSALRAASAIINGNGGRVATGSTTTTTDVLIIGSGPTARAVASLLSNDKLDVVLADKNYDREWVPNYGVWQDEWEAVSDMYPAGLKISDCINRKWGVTDCFFGGSFDIPVAQRFRIDRPYWRVDRNKLRKNLSPREGGDDDSSGVSYPSYRVIRANHVVDQCLAPNVYTPASAIMHDETGTTVTLSDGTVVRTKLVIDCTGHESKLTRKDPRATDRPGFQIAYGAMVTVDESDAPNPAYMGPYDKEAMTLFDYRTDHFDEGSEELESAISAPTFNYVMPMKDNKVFFEETSLVARPGVSFMECKNRLTKRLKYLGIKVVDIEEEEYCYIPMGGALPALDQRVIGLGGACATVHPSTGYHVCRMMASASDVARALSGELARPDFNPDRAAAAAYHAVWSPENIRQRNFAVFGGEFLMKQNVEGLRGFFDGFFRLPLPMWAGFLAGWPGLPNNTAHETWYARMWFGLNFIARIPTKVALDMAWSILTYSIAEPGFPLPQSVTPLLGEPQSYEYVEKPRAFGDVAAKTEAREMISASKAGEEIPVALEE